MSTFIEELYYGNIEPQELNSELSARLKNKLSELTEKEEPTEAEETILSEDDEENEEENEEEYTPLFTSDVETDDKKGEDN